MTNTTPARPGEGSLPPAQLIAEGAALFTTAMLVAELVARLTGDVQRLEGAISLLIPDRSPGETIDQADQRSQAWAKACQVDQMYDLLGAIAGKIVDLTGMHPAETEGEWSTYTLRDRFGLLGDHRLDAVSETVRRSLDWLRQACTTS